LRRPADFSDEGALAVGTLNSDDRTQLSAVYEAARDELDAEERNTWHGGEEVEQLIGLPVCKLAWASRKADCGFYAAKTPYYRAVLGALHCAATMPQRLSWHPGIERSNAALSTLGYSELLPSRL
jgi:hypothetical protein